jgi:cation-transporting ATPase E
LPRHLTIISSLTIGIPAFFLALGPNERRYVPGFIRRVARFAGPCGVVAGVTTFISYAIAYNAANVSLDQARTAAALTLAAIGLWVLGILARPITPLRALLVGSMVGAFALILAIPGVRHFFALSLPRANVTAAAAVCALVGIAVLEIGWQYSQWRLPKDQRTRRWALTTLASR